jgi:hypothetical protein
VPAHARGELERREARVEAEVKERLGGEGIEGVDRETEGVCEGAPAVGVIEALRDTISRGIIGRE